ncbi:MAG: flippase, partial [Calditrichia bacterium]
AFLLASIGKVGLILLHAPLIAFAWIGLAEVVIGAMGMVIVYHAKGHTLREWKGSLTRAKELLKDSWPLILSGLAIYIQARIDQVMLGQMIGLGEVGQYSVAMRLIEAFGFIPMIIYISAAPTITEAKIQGEAEYYERLLNLYRLMFLLFLIVAIPIFLFSKQIVVILFGEEYKTAGALLALFSIRLFFTNFGVAKSLFITNENLFKYSLITAVAGSLINVALNYILIPKYASIGAIWATIASFTVTIFFIDLFYYRVVDNLKIMLKAVITPWQINFK